MSLISVTNKLPKLISLRLEKKQKLNFHATESTIETTVQFRRTILALLVARSAVEDKKTLPFYFSSKNITIKLYIFLYYPNTTQSVQLSSGYINPVPKYKQQYLQILLNNVPPGIWLPKVNNRNPRAKCEIFSRLTIKTPERRHCVFIVNFEHISHRSSVFIINFEHVIVGWGKALQL